MSVNNDTLGENDQPNDPNDQFDFTDVTQPLIDSQILATATWHRVIYKDIDPNLLRPYLGYRPLDVVKKHLLRQLRWLG